MPCVEAVDASCVLLANGWAPLGSAPADTAIIWGVNRYGQWETARVRLHKANAGRVCYLGTRLTFGAFSQSTRLLSREGELFRFTDLPSGEEPSPMWMELPAVELANDYGFDPSAYIVSALDGIAAASSDDYIAVKCRSPRRRAVSDGLRSTFTKRRSGDAYYFLFDRRLLQDALSNNWLILFEELVSLLFSDSDGALLFDRSESLLVCYCVAYAVMKGIALSVSYDNSLATRLVSCKYDTSDNPSRMSEISCAFVSTDIGVPIRIEWDDRRWNPVLNHLIVG
jgi:hypothetical protein